MGGRRWGSQRAPAGRGTAYGKRPSGVRRRAYANVVSSSGLVGRVSSVMKPTQTKRRRAAAVAVPPLLRIHQIRVALPPMLRIDQITVKIAAASVVAGLGGFLAITQRKPEPCNICGGAGNWGCVICDGEGFMVDGRSRKKCVACVGRGKRICRECEGSGWNKKTNYIVRGLLSDAKCQWAETTLRRMRSLYRRLQSV